jgi:hypothetical protein
MTNSNQLDSFLRIASAAGLVRFSFASGKAEYYCPVRLDEEDSLVDDLVLPLYWGDRGLCGTQITEQGIHEGNWVGDSFHCKDKYGEPVVLQFIQTKVLAPDDAPPAVIESALQQVLALAANNPNQVEEKAVMASLSAAVAQGPHALMHFLFPAQYQVLKTLQNLNQQAAEDEGYDWETLTPALDAVSVSLNAGYGTQLSIGDDGVDDDLGLIPWTAEILDFLKDYVNRTDNLENEAELAFRLLMISIKLHTRSQLDDYLDTLRARLLDDKDDLKTLSSMPLEDVLEQITKPVVA